MISAFNIAIFLLVLGAILLIVEAFIPGFGVFGISGILCIIISAVITVIVFPFGIFIVAAELVVLGIIIYAIYSYLKKKQLTNGLILNETLGMEEKEVGKLEYFIGKEGRTSTPLRPQGKIDFNGMIMEAKSEGGYIPEKRLVKVTGLSENCLIVREIENLSN